MEKMPLCKCGCGKPVAKKFHKYIYTHFKQFGDDNPSRNFKIRMILSKKAKLRCMNPEYIQKQRNVWINDRIPNKRYQITLPLSTRQKMSKAQKGKRHPWGQKLRGRVFTDDHCRHISETRKKMNIHLTSEVKEKLRQSKLGKHQTPETIIKIKAWSDVPENKKKCIENLIKASHMSRKETKIEIKLYEELSKRKIKFKKQIYLLGCVPDAIIYSPNIAIFADGDYWHASPRLFSSNKRVIGKKTVESIRKNDASINALLKEKGFLVLRFWENEINSNVSQCVDKIEDAIHSHSNDKNDEWQTNGGFEHETRYRGDRD